MNLRRQTIFTLIAALAICVILIAATVSETPHDFTEIDVPNGDGDWHYLRGDYACLIWGVFDSATVDVETLVTGSKDTPTKLKNVAVSSLVSVTSETKFVGISMKQGYYRMEVSGGLGSELINFHCRN